MQYASDPGIAGATGITSNASERLERLVEMHALDGYSPRRVVSVINGKGGVGKTTVASNCAGLLANSGYKVLIIDMDPQANVGEDLGYTGTQIDDEGQELASKLTFGGSLEVVRNVRDNLDVVPGGEMLERATAALNSQSAKDGDGARLALARVLAPIVDNYDMVVIDCPPKDELLQTAALVASGWALIPAKSDAGSRKGIQGVANRLASVLDLNPDLDLLGVVLFGVTTSAKKVREYARNAIAEAFGREDVVFDAAVRNSEATGQAARERGLLVHELEDVVAAAPKWFQVVRGEAQAAALAPSSAKDVAADFSAVTQELVHRLAAVEARQESPA